MKILIIYSLVINIGLLACLLTPDIVYLIHKKRFILKNVAEWGYSTPKQYRYSKGTIVVLLESGVVYKIIETGRHDYLICREDNDTNYKIVLQSEIKLK